MYIFNTKHKEKSARVGRAIMLGIFDKINTMFTQKIALKIILILKLYKNFRFFFGTFYFTRIYNNLNEK